MSQDGNLNRMKTRAVLRILIFLYCIFMNLLGSWAWSETDGDSLSSYLQRRFFLDISLNPIYQVNLVTKFKTDICKLLPPDADCFTKHFPIFQFFGAYDFDGSSGQCESTADETTVEREDSNWSESIKLNLTDDEKQIDMFIENLLLLFNKTLHDKIVMENDDGFRILMEFFTGKSHSRGFIHFVVFFKWIFMVSVFMWIDYRVTHVVVTEETQQCQHNIFYHQDVISPIADGVFFDLTHEAMTDGITTDLPLRHDEIHVVYDDDEGLVLMSGLEPSVS